MATIYSPYGKTFYPSGSNNPRKIRDFITYEITETDLAYRVKVTACGIQLSGGDCGTNSGTMTLSATGKASSTGSGGFAYQGATTKTLISNKTYEWAKTSQAQSKTIRASYVVSSGIAKGTYTCTLNVNIPALITKTLTYVSEADVVVPLPVVIYGNNSTVTVSDIVPVRTGYDFKGWNTAQDGSGIDVEGTYTFYGGVTETTIYAMWHLSYVPPVFANMRAYRVASSASGSDPDVLSDGTRVYFDCDYEPPQQTAAVNPVSSSLKLVGKNQNFTLDTGGGKIYGYTSSGVLGTTEKDNIELRMLVTDYEGNIHEYIAATYISSEETVFDAFKGTQGGETYQSFAVGTTARDFNSPDRDERGNFDIKMKLTVGDVDFSISNDEYDELLSDLGGAVTVRLIDWLYPIGAIIESANADFDPNTLYSTQTWVRIKGKYLIGVDEDDDDFAVVGEVAIGEKMHTLTVEEMPEHIHKTRQRSASGTSTGWALDIQNTNCMFAEGNIEDAGNNQPHNNIPPSFAVYIWQRTA